MLHRTINTRYTHFMFIVDVLRYRWYVNSNACFHPLSCIYFLHCQTLYGLKTDSKIEPYQVFIDQHSQANFGFAKVTLKIGNLSFRLS